MRNPYPLETKGDGNCLLWAAARCIFGYATQEQVAELRVRVVCHAILEKDWYLQHKNLGIGMCHPTVDSPISELYASMGGEYDGSYKLPQDLEKIYETMIFNYRRPGVVCFYDKMHET